eukprot:2883704-Prymnesium_polylepis.1
MCGAGGAGESAPAGRSCVQCGPVPCTLRRRVVAQPVVALTAQRLASPDTMLPALTRRDAATARGSRRGPAVGTWRSEVSSQDASRVRHTVEFGRFSS